MNNRNINHQSPKPKVPSMRLERKRIESFNRIHWPFKNNLSPQSMAACGLFYDGLGDDFVKCFHCEAVLGNWEENSDPWIEHALASTHCFFLNCRRISQVQAHPYSRRPERRRTPSASLSRPPPSPIYAPPRSPSPARSPVYLPPSPPRSPLFDVYSPPHSPVFDVEYSPPSSPQRHLQSSDDESDLEDPATLFQTQDPEPTIPPDDAIACKICLENPMNIVLQPCTHLFMCKTCSERVTECPVCRKPIKHRYKVILP